MKRIIALLLALITVAFSLISCADFGESQREGTTTVDPGATAPVITEDPYPTKNPTLNYNDAVIKILSRSKDWVADEIWAEAPEGEPINDAVFKRNNDVERILGIQIENTMLDGDQYAVYKKIETLHKAPSAEESYDFFANSTYSTVMYSNLGYFADLKNCEYIEFDQPWFSQNFNETVSLGDAQYAVTGSMALSMYRFIFATFFNTELMESILPDGEDIYDIVNEGKWTIDYQGELAAKIWDDDGDGKKDEGDVFGFITNHDMIGVDPYWSAMNVPILVKNAEGYYEVDVDCDRLSSVVDKINNLIWVNRGTYAYAHSGSDAEQDTIAEKFGDGGAAMATLRIIACESSSLRNNENYGIIPIPKYSTKGGYKSYAHDQITGFFIPDTIRQDEERFQRAGAVLNEMNRQSIITVQPDYYELALKSKYLNDEKSWNMLDMIVQNLYLDGGILYTKVCSSIHQKMRDWIGDNNNSVMSSLKPTLSSIDKELQKFMDEVKALQNEAPVA